MSQRTMLRRLPVIGATIVVGVTTSIIAQQPASGVAQQPASGVAQQWASEEIFSGCVTRDHRGRNRHYHYWRRTEVHDPCPPDIFVDLCEQAQEFNGHEQVGVTAKNVMSCAFEPDGEIVEEYQGRQRVGSVKRNCAPNITEPHVVGETNYGRTRLELDGRYEGTSWTVHGKILDTVKGSYGRKYGHIYLDADGHTVEVPERYYVKPGEVGAYYFTPKIARLTGTWTLKSYAVLYGWPLTPRYHKYQYVATAEIEITAPAVLPNGEWDGIGEYVVVETCDGGDEGGGQLVREGDEAEEEGRTGQPVDEPAQRELLHPGPGQGDGLAEEEESVVPMPQCAEGVASSGAETVRHGAPK
jgi:hypothetical protein